MELDKREGARGMRNLLEETVLEINGSDHVVENVSWVGSMDGKYAITWDAFTEISDVLYDDGYGSQEVAADLVVVFDDGSHLERYEYDGSEYWVYCPVIETDFPINSKSFNNVVHIGESVAGMNKDTYENKLVTIQKSVLVGVENNTFSEKGEGTVLYDRSNRTLYLYEMKNPSTRDYPYLSIDLGQLARELLFEQENNNKC